MLGICLYILHDSDTSRREDDAAIGCIPQVSSCVKASEAMSPLQRQVVVRGLSHDSLELEVVGCAGLNLAPPDVDAATLVTLVHRGFGELVTASGASEATIIAIVLREGFAVFFSVEFDSLIVILGYLLRLGSSCGIHEVFPLEDGLVLSTCRNEELLSLLVS